MTCDAVDELIEPLAAGDLAMTGEIAAHLDGCVRCRRALAVATTIERTLAAQPAPAVPDAFVPAVMARVRVERWRSEQHLDLIFNALVGLAVLVATGGLVAVMSVSGLSAVSEDLVRFFLRGAVEVTRSAMPRAGMYVAATVLAVSTLALWWWAEHGFEA
jgi:hypothetical protein